MAAQLRAVRKLGVYPRSMREVRYDQTAVDLAAEAIDLLIERDGTGPIWHIMNPNVSTLEQLTGAKMVEDAAFAGKHDIPTHGDGHFGAQGAAPCFFVRFVAYCHILPINLKSTTSWNAWRAMKRTMSLYRQ